jgi:hypothetical protein
MIFSLRQDDLTAFFQFIHVSERRLTHSPDDFRIGTFGGALNILIEALQCISAAIAAQYPYWSRAVHSGFISGHPQTEQSEDVSIVPAQPKLNPVDIVYCDSTPRSIVQWPDATRNYE